MHPTDLPRYTWAMQDPTSKCYYDAQFYPYTAPGVDPFFAATGHQSIFVCRPSKGKDGKYIEYIREWKDSSKEKGQPTELNSVAWTQNIENGNPRLCIAGIQPPIIKIMDVLDNDHVRDLVGHGGPINDLKVSLQNPEILASISEDHRICVWHLGAEYQKKPVAAIFQGADKGQCLAIHDSGRYLLSGWNDSSVQIWAMPDLPNEKTGTDDVRPVYIPHFISNEVHSEPVDCLTFHGDLVISKAALEQHIIIWKIDGFNGYLDPPPCTSTADYQPCIFRDEEDAPDFFGTTYSAFGPRFQRIMTLKIENNGCIWLKFGLFNMPEKRPVLVWGDNEGTIYFWDLQRLEEEWAGQDQDLSGGLGKSPSESSRSPGRSPSVASAGSVSWPKKRVMKESKPPVARDQFTPIAPHRKLRVPTKAGGGMVSRACAWSNGGEWVVTVGEQQGRGFICMFDRWLS
ncbi:WD40-repeat-containing domain protein [Phyllosticta capitalensis]